MDRVLPNTNNNNSVNTLLLVFVFDKMEEAEWTGTIEHTDGTEEEITVPVMRDTETGEIIARNNVTVLGVPVKVLIDAHKSARRIKIHKK